jgi:hypothetical protein
VFFFYLTNLLYIRSDRTLLDLSSRESKAHYINIAEQGMSESKSFSPKTDEGATSYVVHQINQTWPYFMFAFMFFLLGSTTELEL